MRKFPNSSILTIIAKDNETGTKDVLFMYATAIPDYYSESSIYWYDNKGKNGDAGLLWKKLKIRQWLACGKDKDISMLYDHILISKELTIGTIKTVFNFPVFTKGIYDPNPFYDRNQNETEFLLTTNLGYFPQTFLQKENLKILSGHQVSPDIKPLMPVGLFDKDYLFEHLKEGKFGERNFREPYLTFRGIRESANKDGDVQSMIGFYQEDFSTQKKYEALYKDKKGIQNGTSIIDPKTGIFKTELKNAAGNGNISILIDGFAVQKRDYTLIKEIKFDVDPASGAITDTYGTNHMITAKEKERPLNFNSFTWQRDVYASSIDADKRLSDKFRELMSYLGPNILIADPYYLNNIKQDRLTQSVILSHCQVSFLNALSLCSTTTGINQIVILGYNSRANKQFDRDDSLAHNTTEQRFKRYDKVIRNFISLNRLSQYLPSSFLHLKNAKEDFHSRYWFSFSNDKNRLEKCIIVTNSIGNMKEVDFVPVTDEAQLTQITAKYIDLYKTSENELII